VGKEPSLIRYIETWAVKSSRQIHSLFSFRFEIHHPTPCADCHMSKTPCEDYLISSIDPFPALIVLLVSAVHNLRHLSFLRCFSPSCKFATFLVVHLHAHHISRMLITSLPKKKKKKPQRFLFSFAPGVSCHPT
jgi:hypothetical protein